MTRRSDETYLETKKRLWGSPVPGHLKHGKDTRAARFYGCDCGDCNPSGRRTWKTDGTRRGPRTQAERQLRYRAARKGKPTPPDVAHPSDRAYNIYGCRCEPCKEHINARRRRNLARQRHAWRDRARGRWRTEIRNGTPTEVICWPPRNAGPDWQCPHPSHQEAA